MTTLRWPNDLWTPVDPVSAGVADAEAVAVRRGLASGYTPVMSVRRVLLPPRASLETLADEAVQAFARQAGGAERLQLALAEPGGGAPGLSQLLGARTRVLGRDYDLRQLDGLVGDTQEDGSIAVLRLTAACLADQLPVVGPEFTSVLTSLSAGERSQS
ncbi:hypothetical protein [Cellulomonas soli]|nr:hypothetical protein [Cellulomonas soli]NYI58718.1 hypothetical protein [Cellulomonas soli]